MTQLNKEIIGAIRLVIDCESSREKIFLTVSKVRYITSSESEN